MSLEAVWLAAWLEGLRRASPPVTMRLVELPTRIRLDDTGRPPIAPLRPDGGDRA